MKQKWAIVFSLIFLICTAGFAEESSKQGPSTKQEQLVIEIYHCTSCGFRKRAMQLAGELNAAFGIEPKLVAGEVGSFDIFLNGDLIFSRAKAGRFPEPGEIVAMVSEHTSR